MRTSNDLTVTSNRMEQSITKAVNRVAGPQITQQIQSSVESERIRTGVITKFYHFLDKAEVQFDNSDETALCKILHRFGGELTEYYTPVEDDIVMDEELHEICVIPREELHVCVLNIQNDDEPLILGFYQADELVGVNPAEPGNLKIVTRGGTNQFWIKFGYAGLDLRLPNTVVTNTGEMDSEMQPVDYADSNNVYTKDEVYTKEEVDELIQKAINEALNEEDTE